MGCVTETIKTTAVPTLETYQVTLPSEEVLDIAVVVFDPGIADIDPEAGIYPEIRRAEATFRARELSLVLDDQQCRFQQFPANASESAIARNRALR